MNGPALPTEPTPLADRREEVQEARASVAKWSSAARRVIDEAGTHIRITSHDYGMIKGQLRHDTDDSVIEEHIQPGYPTLDVKL